MAVKKKKIEFYKVILTTMDGQKESKINFEEILNSKDLINEEVFLKGKDLEMKIFKNDSDKIVGLIETTHSTNVPPKKNKRDKELSKLGLNKDEGLAYGNVFLYDLKRKILLYEINKFGCYLDHFISFIYLALKKNKSKLYKKFRLKLEVVLTSNEYNRILDMNFHKSIEIQIAYPNKIISDIKHKT